MRPRTIDKSVGIECCSIGIVLAGNSQIETCACDFNIGIRIAIWPFECGIGADQARLALCAPIDASAVLGSVSQRYDLRVRTIDTPLGRDIGSKSLGNFRTINLTCGCGECGQREEAKKGNLLKQGCYQAPCTPRAIPRLRRC